MDFCLPVRQDSFFLGANVANSTLVCCKTHSFDFGFCQFAKRRTQYGILPTCVTAYGLLQLNCNAHESFLAGTNLEGWPSAISRLHVMNEQF